MAKNNLFGIELDSEIEIEDDLFPGASETEESLEKPKGEEIELEDEEEASGEPNNGGSKEEETNEEDDDNSDEKSQSLEDIILAIATDFHTEGFFPDLEESEITKIKTYDDFAEALNKQNAKIINNRIEDFTNKVNEKSQGLIEHILNGGTVDNYINIHSDSIENIDYEELGNNENLCKEVIRKNYKKILGLSDEKIEKKLSRIVDFEDEAKEAYDELKEYEAKSKKKLEEDTKFQAQAAKEAQIKYQEDIKKNVYAINEFLPGQKVDEKVKQEVLKGIPSTLEKINNNKEKYIPILAYLDKYGILDKGIGDILEKKATSVGTKKLMDVLGKKTSLKENNEGKTDKYNTIMDFAKRK